MFDFFRKSQLILGINARNIKYLKPSRTRKGISVADNKLLTKELLRKFGLPILPTYDIIKNRQELNNFNWQKLPKSFALKPNRGLGGAGILIVYGKSKKEPNCWIKADRSKVRIADLRNRIMNILDGGFSITNLPDIAFFEERLKVTKLLKPYCYRGNPDIRIIVYNHIPLMAELRLPTKESNGRANLHRGGIGVGIDMGSGITTTAIQFNKLIDYVPGTRLSLKGIKIPFWLNILELAIQAQIISKIGFLGVDIAIDREKGPIILELNARPGLSIQIANLAPLEERLRRVSGLKIKTINKAIRVAQDLFGGEIEEELEEISGRKVIGINEPIEIIDFEGKHYPTLAKIDTGAYRTSICQELASRLGLKRIIDYKKVKSALGIEERPIVEFSFILDKKLVSTEAFLAKRSEMKYDIIVGRKDLKQYLIDPAKNVFMGSRKTRI